MPLGVEHAIKLLRILDDRRCPITALMPSGAEHVYCRSCFSCVHKDNNHTEELVRNWLHNRNTLKSLGIREQLNNPHFNPVEFDGIKVGQG